MNQLGAWLLIVAGAGSGLAIYAVAGMAAALDPILPVIPSETILVAGAVLSTRADGPSILVLAAAGAVGALAGDNLMYWLGRIAGTRVLQRLAGGRRGEERVRWATAQIQRHGPIMVIGGRFIPGGRTAVTLGAGALGMPWPRFLLADACAALTWSVYACGLGRLGGVAFESTWKSLLLSFAMATVLTVILEAIRRLRSRG